MDHKCVFCVQESLVGFLHIFYCISCEFKFVIKILQKNGRVNNRGEQHEHHKRTVEIIRCHRPQLAW